jgi:hypothetical protein
MIPQTWSYLPGYTGAIDTAGSSLPAATPKPQMLFASLSDVEKLVCIVLVVWVAHELIEGV